MSNVIVMEVPPSRKDKIKVKGKEKNTSFAKIRETNYHGEKVAV